MRCGSGSCGGVAMATLKIPCDDDDDDRHAGQSLSDGCSSSPEWVNVSHVITAVCRSKFTKL